LGQDLGVSVIVGVRLAYRWRLGGCAVGVSVASPSGLVGVAVGCGWWASCWCGWRFRGCCGSVVSIGVGDGVSRWMFGSALSVGFRIFGRVCVA